MIAQLDHLQLVNYIAYNICVYPLQSANVLLTQEGTAKLANVGQPGWLADSPASSGQPVMTAYASALACLICREIE